jgi:DNA-directed RNA polymerase subunit RPC12/RpoP
MPISFVCEHCGRSLNVRDDLAGAEIYCPDCRAILTVPGRELNSEETGFSEQTEARPEFHLEKPEGNDEGVVLEGDSVLEEADKAPGPTSSETGTQGFRPLLVIAGMGFIAMAIGCVAMMLRAGKVRPGFLRLTIVLAIFGLATLIRGLGRTTR